MRQKPIWKVLFSLFLYSRPIYLKLSRTDNRLQVVM